MNTAANINVVHESEAQRQHARVKLPALLRFQSKNKERIETRVLDLSAGGLSFSIGKNQFSVGDFYKARLQFQIDSVNLGLDVELQVRTVDTANDRVGCQFHNLSQQDIATLRHLISAHLGGEIISVGNLLHTLQRENFTKARKSGGGGGMSAFGRFRAVAFSAAIFVIGVAAFAFILQSLYNLYFVTHAQSAKVNVSNMQVTMPREGTVQSLLPEGTVDVEKGAPIASFSASMLEMLKGHLADDQLSPAKVEELFGKQMKGTLTSPCNCKVARQYVADGQFAAKGDVIFELVPQDTTATITASFPYRSLSQVKPGTRVSFWLPDESEPRRGRIVSTDLHEGGLSSDIRAQIKPEQPVPSTLANQPVEVVVDRGPTFDWMIDKAIAAGL
ncbi:alginate biosynthesis protein Alg44 [Pseudomonas sp. LRF_L74]|uniref:alginate biosynthesis protein Alg44 n=1 Tax=Pseudomonas sp. LRF_L74 TaxID=3369422 RepID=UPI003F5EEBA9